MITMNDDAFKILAKKIENLRFEPETLEELIKEIKQFPPEQINKQYKRPSSNIYKKGERLIEIAIAAYVDTTTFRIEGNSRSPESVYLELIRALIEQKADLTLLDSEGQTVLHQAIINRNNLTGLQRYMSALEELFSIFEKSGVSFNVKNKNGDSLLIRCARSNQLPLIPFLHSKYNIDLNLQNNGLGGKVSMTLLDILEDTVYAFRDDIIAYVQKKGGTTGRVHSRNAINDLRNCLGGDAYRKVMQRKKGIWEASPGVLGRLVSISIPGEETHHFETKKTLEVTEIVAIDSLESEDTSCLSKDQDSNQVTHMDTGNETFLCLTPKTLVKKPKSNEEILSKVRVACQLNKAPMFFENTENLSDTCWTFLFEEACKNKAKSGKTWHSVFVQFCAQLIKTCKEKEMSPPAFTFELIQAIEQQQSQVQTQEQTQDQVQSQLLGKRPREEGEAQYVQRENGHCEAEPLEGEGPRKKQKTF